MATIPLFCDIFGISDSTVHRTEPSEQNVTLKTLGQICDGLKCSVSEMFREE